MCFWNRTSKNPRNHSLFSCFKKNRACRTVLLFQNTHGLFFCLFGTAPQEWFVRNTEMVRSKKKTRRRTRFVWEKKPGSIQENHGLFLKRRSFAFFICFLVWGKQEEQWCVSEEPLVVLSQACRFVVPREQWCVSEEPLVVLFFFKPEKPNNLQLTTNN